MKPSLMSAFVKEDEGEGMWAKRKPNIHKGKKKIQIVKGRENLADRALLARLVLARGWDESPEGNQSCPSVPLCSFYSQLIRKLIVL